MKYRKSHGEEEQILMIAAARLCSNGDPQVKIAQKLKTSQSEISRLLARAVNEGYLSRLPTVIWSKIKPEDNAEVERRYFADRDLNDRLQKSTPAGEFHFELRVFDGDYDDFCFAAGGWVIELIRSVERI